MATDGTGPRGPREPQSGLRIAGVEVARFSRQALSDLETMSERDQWQAAHDAYHPANRPRIVREYNPRAQGRWAGAPEVWFVYVPRTGIAWDADLLRREAEHLIPSRFFDDRSTRQGPSPRVARALRAWRQHSAARQQEQERLLLAQQVVAFPNADAAERFAQARWRAYWAQRLPQQWKDVRARFAQDAVIEVVRLHLFTVDHADPVQATEWELWEATHPLADWPDGFVVHHKHAGRTPLFQGVDRRQAAWVRAFQAREPAFGDASAPSAQIADPDRVNWGVAAAPGPQEPGGADGPASAEVWRLAPIDHALHYWVALRPDGDGWQFWANGTGRPVACRASDPTTAARMLPRSEPWSLDPWPGPHYTPDPLTLGSLFEAARGTKVYRMAPEVAEWLDAGRALARAMREPLQQRPALRRQTDRWMAALVAVHQQVFPPDGILTSSPYALAEAHRRLVEELGRHWPDGATRAAVVGLAQHWHQLAGPLAQDALGLFPRGRLAPAAFRDPNVEHGARVDALSDWAAMELPGTGFIVGRLTARGQRVAWAEARVYDQPEAVAAHVKNRGGTVTFGRAPGLPGAWRRALARAHGTEVAARMVADLYVVPTIARMLETAPPRRTIAPTTEDQPRPARPNPEHLKTLYVAPIGGGRGVVWTDPDPDGRDDAPRLVAKTATQLLPLSRYSREYPWPTPIRDRVHPDRPLPETQQVWVVPLTDGLQAAVDAVAAVARDYDPHLTVAAAPLADATVVRALAERWDLRAAPYQRLDEPCWAVRPTPRGTAMLVCRQWQVAEKPAYPGEFVATDVAIPYRVPGPNGRRVIAEWPSVAAAHQALTAKGLAHQVVPGIPREANDWFDPPVIRVARTVPEDALGALATTDRWVRAAFLEDLRAAQREAQVPVPLAQVQSRYAAAVFRGLRGADWAAVMPEAAQQAATTWDAVEAQVQDYARTWLAQRPALTARLQHGRAPALSR